MAGDEFESRISLLRAQPYRAEADLKSPAEIGIKLAILHTVGRKNRHELQNL
jgi:hypothetical protein